MKYRCQVEKTLHIAEQETCLFYLIDEVMFAIVYIMNVVQKQLLELADTLDLGNYSYYGLAKRLQVNHPYKVQFAIEQLIKTGHLIKNSKTGSIFKPQDDITEQRLIHIPYYGQVNCGEALTLANDQVESYLKITPNVIHTSDLEGVFALKASGSSMNRARIGGKSVNEGDYVIARRKNAYQPKNGDYVVSIIWGAANLKRFYRDDDYRQILLVSESTQDLPPIVISEQDAVEPGVYSIAAEAIDVVPMATR